MRQYGIVFKGQIAHKLRNASLEQRYRGHVESVAKNAGKEVYCIVQQTQASW